MQILLAKKVVKGELKVETPDNKERVIL